jgi:hypothetical protein
MSEVHCAIAADTKLETPEGATTVKGLAAKTAPVFTIENGRVRFRMVQDAALIAEAAPVVAIRLDNGASFRVGSEQIIFRKGMVETRAADLQPGDALVPMFSYVEGYTYRNDATGSDVVSDAAVHVVSVAPAGAADLYGLRVNVTGCFFVSAGVLCKAAGS